MQSFRRITAGERERNEARREEEEEEKRKKSRSVQQPREYCDVTTQITRRLIDANLLGMREVCIIKYASKNLILRSFFFLRFYFISLPLSFFLFFIFFSRTHFCINALGSLVFRKTEAPKTITVMTRLLKGIKTVREQFDNCAAFRCWPINPA
ncbi:hypothetical protein PUN28_012475 [Cardiocondyla obscurior]|uniref:Uncharacterized protein n=1 Tax=Cardiocondyla obscurior TaxID=286306 RepID=A0AAW2FF08_9HYME